MRTSILFFALMTSILFGAQQAKAGLPAAKLESDGTTMTILYLNTAKPESYKYADEWGEWKDVVTKVVFDESMKNSVPTSTVQWFKGFAQLTTIENLSYLNTSEVETMNEMFYGCTRLTGVNVTKFNTAKVINMYAMFAYCRNLTALDICNFSMVRVTGVEAMFKGCDGLQTIYCNDNWTKLGNLTGENMFSGCTALVGQNGTGYDAEHVDVAYAHPDYTGNKGYFTKRAVCWKPTNVQITNLKATSVTFEWEAENGYHSTQIRKAEGTWSSGASAIGFSMTYNNLDPETDYEIRVRTECTSTSYSEWETLSFTTPAECTAPTNLKYNNLSATGVTLKWTGSLTHQDHIVNWKKSTESEYNTMYTKNNYQNLIGYLEPETTYDVQIIAKCGTSNYSDPLVGQFTTPALPCELPTDLLATETTTTSLLITWTGHGESKWRLIHQRKGDPSSIKSIDDITTNSYMIEGLIQNTSYLVSLQADCGSNQSEWTDEVEFTTAAMTPTTVCKKAYLDYISQQTTTATIDILEVEDQVAWLVRWKPTTESQWTTISTSTTTVQLTSLTPETEYELQIKADCGDGNTSAWSDSYNFTTEKEEVIECLTPTNVLFNYENGLLKATWTPGKDEQAWVYYVYYRDTEVGNDYVFTPETEAYNVLQLGFEPGNKLGIAVSAVCDITNEIYSDLTEIAYFEIPNTEGFDNILTNTRAAKVLRDGHLFIERNGKIYHITGIELK